MIRTVKSSILSTFFSHSKRLLCTRQRHCLCRPGLPAADLGSKRCAADTSDQPGRGAPDHFVWSPFFTTTTYIIIFKIVDSFSEIGIRLLQALGFASIFLAGVYYFFPDAIIEKGVFVVSVGLAILFIVSWRITYNHILNQGLFNQKLIILGSGKLAQVFAMKSPKKGLRLHRIGNSAGRRSENTL